MQKNTEHIPNRDDVSTAILQHLDGLRGIDTHCHHLPDDQFQNMGVKFLYNHSYCNWMDDLLGLLHSYSNVYAAFSFSERYCALRSESSFSNSLSRTCLTIAA